VTRTPHPDEIDKCDNVSPLARNILKIALTFHGLTRPAACGVLLDVHHQKYPVCHLNKILRRLNKEGILEKLSKNEKQKLIKKYMT
jgi:hypothetical protein